MTRLFTFLRHPIISSTVALCAGLSGSRSVLAAERLTAPTITQVVKDVRWICSKDKSAPPAKINDLFTVSNAIRTGPDSRVEISAPDQTVTRIGANTLFSCDTEKSEIHLQRGSVLFDSPAGRGGGTIRTASVTATVLGATLLVGTTHNGGFKVLLIEGKGRIRTTTGKTRTIVAGQMVYALPGGDLSHPVFFRLSQQVATSALLGGFKKNLPSAPKIQAAIAEQEALIAAGKLKNTGILAGDQADSAYQNTVTSRDRLVQVLRTDASLLDTALRSRERRAPVPDRPAPALDSSFVLQLLKALRDSGIQIP